MPALAWTSSELGPFDTPAEAVLATFRELGARLGVAEIIRLRKEATPMPDPAFKVGDRCFSHYTMKFKVFAAALTGIGWLPCPAVRSLD